MAVDWRAIIEEARRRMAGGATTSSGGALPVDAPPPSEGEDARVSSFASLFPTLTWSLGRMLSDMTGVSESAAKDYVSEWAYEFYQTHYEQWPGTADIWADPAFLMGALRLPTWQYAFPDTFAIQEANGTFTWVDNTGPAPTYSQIDPVYSYVQQSTVPSWAQQATAQQGALASSIPGTHGAANAAEPAPARPQQGALAAGVPGTHGAALATGPQPVPANVGFGLGANRDLGMEDVLQMAGTAGAASAAMFAGNVPIYTRELFDLLLSQFQGASVSYGGGGGGRAEPVWDRAELQRAVTDMWQQYLREIPANSQALADQFIQAATSFYSEGGDLDFETWMLGKIRQSNRYAVLYGHKPEGVTEEDYMGRVQNVVSQFGFNPQMQEEEIIKGMTAPVNLQSFAERLAGTRQYQVANRGDLSQMFASAFQGLGVLRGS